MVNIRQPFGSSC